MAIKSFCLLLILLSTIQSKDFSIEYESDFDSVVCGAFYHKFIFTNAVTFKESRDVKNYTLLEVQEFSDFSLNLTESQRIENGRLPYYLSGPDAFIRYYNKGRIVNTAFIYNSLHIVFDGRRKLFFLPSKAYKLNEQGQHIIDVLLELRYHQLPQFNTNNDGVFFPLNEEDTKKFYEHEAFIAKGQ